MAVGEQGSRAQGKRWPPTTAVQGGGWSHGLRVRLKHGRLLGLLVLAGHFPVAGLDALFLHGEGPVDLWGKGGEKGVILRLRCYATAAAGTAVGLTLCSLK